ncbi:nucleoside hydrolase [Saccharata proteae CBS 121410]|uniref:Nucleoside hydrolase n=1 Tax=Saccharata proteae CBS 121410 TaxID=1314787 RepID=A0A9P4LXL3_9PEZI|nr:nucleoside hydrolase [Saccharata proteae CBS 121410]
MEEGDANGFSITSCLRNTVAMFHWIEKEMSWRKEKGLPPGFDTLRATKPIVAVGAEEPLADQMMLADYFHGTDGLGGIHSSHPHLTPEETWKDLFSSALKSPDQETAAAAQEAQQPNALFTPSTRPAHEEILRILRENDPDTITIVAIGPLTNLALAAAADTETFLRVKEVVVMGGTIEQHGNVGQPTLSPPHQTIKEPPFRLIKAPDTKIRAELNIRNQMTPVAEFNTYADSIAAARIYALTSPNPHTTMPPTPPTSPGKETADPPPPFLQPYPKNLSKQLKLTIFPLDITNRHTLTRGTYTNFITPLLSISPPSPLATWTHAFLSSTYTKITSLHTSRGDADSIGLELHDPLCIWYVLLPDSPMWRFAESVHGPVEDIRVETTGQWTRGMCVVDRRGRRRRRDDGIEGEVPGDTGNWLSGGAGNRVRRVVRTPGEDVFGAWMLGRIFGGS